MPGGWLSHFEAGSRTLLRDLEALVRMESPSDDAESVSRLTAWIRDRLSEDGVAAELRPCRPRGAALLASVGAAEGGTLLLGHLDTVWPVGTLAERPWRVDGGRAYGPGVFDMKAGVAVGMAVLSAVSQRPTVPRVSMLLVPDEEIGSAASRELTVAVARQHRQVLVLEPSQDGAAKVARKGCGIFHVRFSGRAAHAGLEPEKGASALAEMARFVVFVDGVTDLSKGTTLTPTVARSGTATNVVPEAAELSVDGRSWSREEADRVTAAIRGYGPADERVAVSVEGGFDRPPLEPSAASTALYEAARRVAADLGFPLGAARVGGGSDGNFTAAAGMPTLDGLGPRGDGAHARDEHVVVDDLPLRAALVAALVCDCAEGPAGG
jgi:glutamate carboxypeptidase